MKQSFALLTILFLFILIIPGCYKEPIASFKASSTSIILGESITFTNTSQDMDRCEWLFGDGGQSTKTSPTYTYQAPGTFVVTLRVFSKKDIKADVTTASITVSVLEPVASFTVSSTQVITGTQIVFTNTSQNVYRCEWDFGDGTTSTATNPTHTFSTPGTYDVNLRVYSAGDVKSDATYKTIEITVEEPVASFTMSSSSISVGGSVTFTNTSQNMDRCEWDFGDGETSTQTNPVHTFDEAGTYKVNLRVFSVQDVESDIATGTVTVTQPTILWVNVYTFDEDPIASCSVTLYSTFDDWNNSENPLASATTNSSGRAVFTDIDAGEVFIDVYKKIDDTYFYCNWFVQYQDNLYKTTVVANKINEVDVHAYYSWYTKKVAVQMTE
jgi:PKD repeat protein